MERDLLEISTGRLLEKFGAGSHKPGSGSAAALMGMLSAQLVRTVVSLTTDESRKHKYSDFIPRLEEMASEMQKRIYPELVRLFREDSAQFDKVIQLRQARDEEINLDRKKGLANQALLALKPATEMPIEIATLCAELAGFAQFVFDHAFRPARGDSGIALSVAVAAVAGCISIIDLNLLSFGSDEWTDKIRSEVDLLRSSYESRYSETEARLQTLQRAAEAKRLLSLALNELSSRRLGPEAPYSEIERKARQLQRLIWRYRRTIWKGELPKDPIDMLKPENAFKIMGYSFDRQATLGQHENRGDLFEVAGLIDQGKRTVVVSEQFPPETQNFTAAHELGHALLHEQNVLHRDRALDDSTPRGARDLQELQADKFASYFLMPRKLLKSVFQSVFLTEKFYINEQTTFALNAGSTEALRKQCGNLRGLSRTLARAKHFNGRQIYSLSERFRVSTEAMAIRLEELELLEF